jgi:membrane dipeptidase
MKTNNDTTNSQPSPGRRNALGILGAIGAACSLPALAHAANGLPSDLYRRSIVIDAQSNVDVDPAYLNEKTAALPPFMLPLMESGITAVSMTVGDVGTGPDRFQSVLRDIAGMSSIVANFPDYLMVALRAADLAVAKRSKRLAIIYNMQDSNAIEADLTRVQLLHDVGVRTIQMTYNLRNLSGDGSLENADAGLSRWGNEVVAELEKCKILVDISHGGRRLMADVAARAKRPLTISHTACRALVDIPRNTDDATMRKVAQGGGVVGIYFMPFLRQPGTGMARSADLLAHIEHAIQVCGEDGVGIGTDGGVAAVPINDKTWKDQKEFYDSRKARGIAAPGEAADVLNIVEDYNAPRRLETMAFDMSRRGWSDRRIEKILGANFMRLYGEVW